MIRTGRKTTNAQARELSAAVKDLYFNQGLKEREVAAKLGISRMQAHYYKTAKK